MGDREGGSEARATDREAGITRYSRSTGMYYLIICLPLLSFDSQRTNSWDIRIDRWAGGKLEAGETYVKRGYMFTSKLGSVKATADSLSPEVYVDEITLELVRRPKW